MRGTRPTGDSPIADVINGFVQQVERHQALPPREKAIARAGYGTGLLVLAGYLVWGAPALTGYSAGQLAIAFLSAPASSPVEVWGPIAIFGGVVLLGGTWLISGVRGSAGGPRNGMAAFWSLVRIGIYAWLISWASDASPEWRGWAGLFELLMFDFIAVDVVTFGLQMRGGHKAKRIVEQQIEDAEIPWRPARRDDWR